MSASGVALFIMIAFDDKQEEKKEERKIYRKVVSQLSDFFSKL